MRLSWIFTFYYRWWLVGFGMDFHSSSPVDSSLITHKTDLRIAHPLRVCELLVYRVSCISMCGKGALQKSNRLAEGVHS